MNPRYQDKTLEFGKESLLQNDPEPVAVHRVVEPAVVTRTRVVEEKPAH